MDIEAYKLPADWAVALINDDPSGLDDDDAAALDRFHRAYDGRAWPLLAVNLR